MTIFRNLNQNGWFRLKRYNDDVILFIDKNKEYLCVHYTDNVSDIGFLNIKLTFPSSVFQIHQQLKVVIANDVVILSEFDSVLKNTQEEV